MQLNVQMDAPKYAQAANLTVKQDAVVTVQEEVQRKELLRKMVRVRDQQILQVVFTILHLLTQTADINIERRNVLCQLPIMQIALVGVAQLSRQTLVMVEHV